MRSRRHTNRIMYRTRQIARVFTTLTYATKPGLVFWAVLAWLISAGPLAYVLGHETGQPVTDVVTKTVNAALVWALFVSGLIYRRRNRGLIEAIGEFRQALRSLEPEKTYLSRGDCADSDVGLLRRAPRGFRVSTEVIFRVPVSTGMEMHEALESDGDPVVVAEDFSMRHGIAAVYRRSQAERLVNGPDGTVDSVPVPPGGLWRRYFGLAAAISDGLAFASEDEIRTLTEQIRKAEPAPTE